MEFLTNFYHNFDEYHINYAIDVTTKQYIMNALGTAICPRIALNTGYYKHMVSGIQHNAKHFHIFYSEQGLNLLHITKIY